MEAEGQKVFRELRRTSAYIPDDTIKRKIFLSFWSEAAASLQGRFSSDGRDADDNHGFGYLLEEFAKRSSRLPQNTKAGEHIAGLILSALRTRNDTLVGMDRRLRNPDFLWIKFRGRLAQVQGIGEAKTSVEAYLKKPSQIIWQEDSIHKVLEVIENQKRLGTAHPFFTKRKIVIQGPLRKTLIVPLGAKANISSHLPQDWECEEIEFSYDELAFVAKKLWPNSMPDVTFQEGLLAEYEKGFLSWFFKWGKERLDSIFQEASSDLPLRELLIFGCITGKLPLLEEEIESVASEVRKSLPLLWYYPKCLERNWSKREKAFIKRLSVLASIGCKTSAEEIKKQIFFFLVNLRGIRKNLRPWMGGKQEKISHFPDFNIVRL